MQRCIAVRFRLRCVFQLQQQLNCIKFYPKKLLMLSIFQQIHSSWSFIIYTIRNNNLIRKNLYMNAKSKKYYQALCQSNKQNLLFKHHKNKQTSEKDVNQPLKIQKQKNSHLMIQPPYKNLSNNYSYSSNHQVMLGPRNQSKKNIFLKHIKDNDNNKQNKDKILKLPKIVKQQVSHILSFKRKLSKSYKKILTQPYEYIEDDQINIKTLSPKQSLKQVLLNIVKNKQSRNLISIDDQINKLEVLTKKYSGLRKDLVSIQQDILTIIFKQKYKQKELSQSNSLVII